MRRSATPSAARARITPAGAVRGRHYPPPKPTRGALIAVLLYAGLPLLGIAVAADLLLALAFRLLLDRCYGVLCWV